MPNPEKKIYPFDLIHDEMIFSLTSIKNGLDTLSTAQPYSIHGEPQIYTGLKNLTIGLERYLQTALIFVHYKQGKPLPPMKNIIRNTNHRCLYFWRSCTLGSLF